MKSNRTWFLLPWACLLAGLLSGCDFFQLLAFRAQMRDTDRYTAWEMRAGDRVFVFKSPLLTMEDLNDFGLYPERDEEGNAVLRYRRRDVPGGEPGEYDIRLHFTNARLSGVVFPQKLRDGLGPDNIRRIFAMISGSSDAGSKLEPVAKSQLLSAGLFPADAGNPGHEITIDLEPHNPRNQAIQLEMLETGNSGYYSKFRFSLIRRPQTGPSKP